MEVIFRTKLLKQCFETSSRAVKRWGPVIARKYITRVNELYALKDFEDAARVRSLRLHPLKGGRQGEWSITLTGRWRLIVSKGETEEHVTIVNVSNHYED